MRVFSVTILVILVAAASSRAQLKDSQIIGHWQFDSDPAAAAEQGVRYRLAYEFGADHGYAFRVWQKFGEAENPDPATDFFGLRAEGKWFIDGNRVGLARQGCEGFTPSAQEECGIEATNPSDTSWLQFSREGDSLFLADEGSGQVRFSFRGAAGDTMPPPFWFTSPSPVRPVSAPRPDAFPGGKAIDILGRPLPSGKGPLLFRLSAPR